MKKEEIYTPVKIIYPIFRGAFLRFWRMAKVHKKSKKTRGIEQERVSVVYYLAKGEKLGVEIKRQKARKPLGEKDFRFCAIYIYVRIFLDREAVLWYDIDINNSILSAF